MLSNGFDTPLRLKLDASKLLINFQFLVHLLALTAIALPSAIPFIVKLLLATFIVLSGIMVWRNHRYEIVNNELLV